MVTCGCGKVSPYNPKHYFDKRALLKVIAQLPVSEHPKLNTLCNFHGGWAGSSLFPQKGKNLSGWPHLKEATGQKTFWLFKESQTLKLGKTLMITNSFPQCLLESTLETKGTQLIPGVEVSSPGLPVGLYVAWAVADSMRLAWMGGRASCCTLQVNTRSDPCNDAFTNCKLSRV